ncbi:MAG: hypothetical protein M1833_004893 [Piccolia ochrophora]|nr:MAG: hypothetical protein M1833_004893 [Piccolia ochrophora]
MNRPSRSLSPTSHSKPHAQTPRRLFKPNPLLASASTPTARTTKRREQFLARVRQGRDDRRVAARGGEDEMSRTVDTAEQQRWEAARRNEASNLPDTPEEDGEDAEITLQNDGVADADVLDRVIALEAHDLEALVATFSSGADAASQDMTDREPTAPQEASRARMDLVSSTYGSEDEDYDALFMELLKDDIDFGDVVAEDQGSAEAMDMSNG